MSWEKVSFEQELRFCNKKIMWVKWTRHATVWEWQVVSPSVFQRNKRSILWARKMLHISYLWNTVEFATITCRKLMVQEKKVGICKKIKRRRFACREVSKTKNCPLRMWSSGLLRNVRSQPRVSTFTDNMLLCPSEARFRNIFLNVGDQIESKT